MNVTVYTAIFGNASHPKAPVGISSDPDQTYLCFTDTPGIVQAPWRAAALPDNLDLTDPELAVCQLKALAHQFVPTSTASLWVDSAYTIGVDVTTLAAWALTQHDLAAYRHCVRDCVYDEADEIALFEPDAGPTLQAHLTRLLLAGYPAHAGLHDCSIILRRHSDQVANFNELWWELVRSGSRHDQLSFDFARWRCGLICQTLPDGYAHYPLVEPARSTTPYFEFTAPDRPPRMVGTKPFRPWVA